MTQRIAFYVAFVAGKRTRFYVRDEHAPNTPEGATKFDSETQIDAHPTVIHLRAQGYPVRHEWE